MVLPQRSSLLKAERPGKIRALVRPFRESDSTDVRKLFLEAIITSKNSTARVALKYQLSQTPALIIYGIFFLGLCLAFASQSATRIIGVSLTASTSILFLQWIRNSKKRFQDFTGRALNSDLANIQKQYEAPSKFWVAEVAEGNAAGTVIGCVGLDSSTRPDPKTAEFRRMVVSPSYQGQGVGKLLLTTAVAHARAYGLSDIVLSTSMFQVPAILMYERFGFVEEKRRNISVRFLFIETKFHARFYVLKL